MRTARRLPAVASKNATKRGLAPDVERNADCPAFCLARAVAEWIGERHGIVPRIRIQVGPARQPDGILGEEGPVAGIIRECSAGSLAFRRVSLHCEPAFSACTASMEPRSGNRVSSKTAGECDPAMVDVRVEMKLD